jgi:hypothetical protein
VRYLSTMRAERSAARPMLVVDWKAVRTTCVWRPRQRAGFKLKPRLLSTVGSKGAVRKGASGWVGFVTEGRVDTVSEQGILGTSSSDE